MITEMLVITDLAKVFAKIAIIVIVVYLIKLELPVPTFRLPGYRKLQLRQRRPLCPPGADRQKSTHLVHHLLCYQLSVSLDYDGERHDAAAMLVV